MSGLDLLDTEQDEFDNHFPDIMKIIKSVLIVRLNVKLVHL